MDRCNQKQFGQKFIEMYTAFAEKMRPDLASIEDPETRDKEIFKWMNEMEEPDKLLMDFIETNPMNIKAFTASMDKTCKAAHEHANKVKHLPLEDTIWIVDVFTQAKDENGQTHRSLVVTDKRDLYIGTMMCNILETSLSKQCHDLVCACALHPMVGQPRRPKYVTFKDPTLAEDAVDLDLSNLDICYMYAGMKNNDQMPSIRMRECSNCHVRGSKDLFKKCSSCQALLYCSKVCQKADWSRKGEMAPYSHTMWCGKMKTYMTLTNEMKQLPFIFVQETMSEDFDMESYKTFLESHGVFNQGCWRRECKLHRNTSSCSCCVVFGELPESEDPIVLPVESTILDEPPEEMRSQLLHDWKSYFKYRGLRLDSPIAVLLQWPLTLHYILQYCLPNDSPAWWDALDCSDIRVDVLGVEKEVEMLTIFKEVGYLFPDVTVDIHMYGPEISKHVDKKTYEHENIKITVVQGLYHRKAKSERKPHMVVGFNAGISAYHSWSKTLVKLRTEKTPAYFTDYCQYSCECARLAIEGMCLGTISEPILNPFRSPIKQISNAHDMPCCSNGFLFRVIYPS